MEGTIVAVMAISLLFNLVFGLVSGSIAERKGRSFGGFFALGFFFAFIGVIAALIAMPSVQVEARRTIAVEATRSRMGEDRRRPPRTSRSPERKCPFCAEWIDADEPRCRFCGSDVEAVDVTKPPPVAQRVVVDEEQPVSSGSEPTHVVCGHCGTTNSEFSPRCWRCGSADFSSADGEGEE